MDRLAQQLEFIGQAGRLRGVQRQTMLTEPTRRENSAEHSWHLTVMALALAEHARALGRFARGLVAQAVQDGMLAPGPQQQ